MVTAVMSMKVDLTRTGEGSDALTGGGIGATLQELILAAQGQVARKKVQLPLHEKAIPDVTNTATTIGQAMTTPWCLILKRGGSALSTSAVTVTDQALMTPFQILITNIMIGEADPWGSHRTTTVMSLESRENPRGLIISGTDITTTTTATMSMTTMTSFIRWRIEMVVAKIVGGHSTD